MAPLKAGSARLPAWMAFAMSRLDRWSRLPLLLLPPLAPLPRPPPLPNGAEADDEPEPEPEGAPRP